MASLLIRSLGAALALACNLSLAQADSVAGFLSQAFTTPRMEQRWSVNHIGLTGAAREDGFLVHAVLEQSPAFAAGIERGDLILAANGEAFHPIRTFTEAGEVTLQLRRGETEREVTLSPRRENLYDAYRAATRASVMQFPSGNKVIGYVRFWALSRNSGDLVMYRELIKELELCDGIVLDLRNSFGFWSPAHNDLFLPIPNSRDNYERPVIVLINRDTPPGAERFARELQGLERITTLGETTSGGLEPEIVVPYPYTQTTRNDPQFDAAVNSLLGII